MVGIHETLRKGRNALHPGDKLVPRQQVLTYGQVPRIFNPAVVSESKLNWLTLAYVLTAGTIYWYAIGWLGDWVYRRLRKPRANEIGSSVGEKK